jgi:hypothetical protein
VPTGAVFARLSATDPATIRTPSFGEACNVVGDGLGDAFDPRLSG